MGPRTWPDDWAARRAGDGCVFCGWERPDEDEHGLRFLAGAAADAYLQRRAPAPGYAIVVFRGRHAADPIDLTLQETAAFWADVGAAARAIYAVFGPCHLNYQILGNAMPHVHAHLVPRYLDDPSPERPLAEAVWAAAPLVPEDELRRQVAALEAALI